MKEFKFEFHQGCQTKTWFKNLEEAEKEVEMSLKSNKLPHGRHFKKPIGDWHVGDWIKGNEHWPMIERTK